MRKKPIEHVIDVLLDTSRPLQECMGAVRGLCAMDRALAYRLEVDGERVLRPLFVATSPELDAAGEAGRAWIERHGFPSYKLPRPDPREINCALRNSDLALDWSKPTLANYNEAVQRPFDIGYPENDQLRVLVCDGSEVLAWVGGYRRGGRFGGRERQNLQALVPALRSRLVFERRAQREAIGNAAFHVLLERSPGPALLVDECGSVVFANAAAERSGLVRDRDKLRALVASRGKRVGSTQVVEVSDRSVPRHFLILSRAAAPRLSLAARLERRAEQWRLTPRERQVAELLTRGLTTKEIAAQLGCVPGTAELHVSSVLRKASVPSRARLLAAVWGDGG